MTDEERVMLLELHNAFLKKPLGAGEKDKPLLEDVREIVQAYKRFGWLFKTILWATPIISGVAVFGREVIQSLWHN